jgi:drug/metabolite transporter (DMT)-like permease
VNTSTASTGLGLLSAASWGGSDFVGGIGARKGPALLVALIGQAVPLVILVAIGSALHLTAPGRHATLLAAIGGFEGALALALFYRALAMGAMGLTAALTGLITALVPVLFSALHYGLPSPVSAAGLVLGCAAIWLITHQPSTEPRQGQAAALVLGAIAGAGFGMQLILFNLAELNRAGLNLDSPVSLVFIVTIARAAGVTALALVALLWRPGTGGRELGRGWALIAVAAGLLDTVGNLFYLGAARFGRLDAAAVICSLYPAGTILLAGLFLREKPSRRQIAGIAMALAAVALLSR